MLDELIKTLGPIAGSIVIGMIGLAAGGFAIYRGIQSNKPDGVKLLEAQRAEWEAYNQLRNIEQNTFKIAENQEKLIAAMVRLTDAMWNRSQWKDH